MFQVHQSFSFFDQFLSLLKCLRNERDHSTLMALAKKSVSTLEVDSPEHQYAETFTPYAFEYVQKQLSLRRKVSIQTAAGKAREFIVDSSNGKLKVTCNTCMCMYWTSIHFPCCHIFAVRDKCHVPLFDPILVTQWGGQMLICLMLLTWRMVLVMTAVALQWR